MTYKLAKTSQDADPYFGAVSLLLDGTDLLDKSLDTKAITVNGDAQVSTAQSKWNGSSLSFDGTGDSFYIADANAFNFGTGDFTVECWLYQSAFNVDTIIDFRGSSTYGFAVYSDVIANGQARVYDQLAVFKGQSTIAFNTNSWNHFALVRSGGTVTAYINGQNGLSYSDTSDYQIASARIGDSFTLNQGLNGYLQDVRITKGVARYTANFTPPTQPLKQFQDRDPHFNSVELLLLGDGANASTNIVDSSNDPKTISVIGNTQISTAQSKYRSSSLYFDGAGDYLLISPSSDFAFGTGDFTIEMWLYRTGSGQQHLYDGRRTTATNRLLIYLDSSAQLGAYVNGSNIISSSTAPALNQWVHIAFCRSAGTSRLFADGVQVGDSYADTINYSAPTDYLVIGANGALSGSYLQGYIDDLRVTTGVARYTSNFTPTYPGTT